MSREDDWNCDGCGALSLFVSQSWVQCMSLRAEPAAASAALRAQHVEPLFRPLVF